MGEEEWRQADPHPDERDSFHYRTSEKERERESEGDRAGWKYRYRFILFAAPPE